MNCTHHCRSCGGHFNSLRAFDAHRGPQDDRRCNHERSWGVLQEAAGACEIGYAEARTNVTVQALGPT